MIVPPARALIVAVTADKNDVKNEVVVAFVAASEVAVVVASVVVP